jgi:Domain of unknown function (DUF4340)
MTARRVVMLLAAGVLVIAFAVWLSSTRNPEPATLAGNAVLPGLDKATLNSVSEVRLSKGDGTKTTLKKGATDWMIAERDYAADSGKVRKLLLDLAALNVVEEKTRAAENYPALGVEDTTSSKATGTRVDAVTPARTFSLIVGKSSGAKSGYVRLPNSPQSLLAAPLITLDADPRRWLDNKLIDIPQDRIREISVKPADGPGYTATRASKDQSDFTVAEVPKGRELSSPAAADPIAGSLGSLSLDDVRHAPTAPPAGTPPPAVSHAIFRTFDGLEIDVAGHKDGNSTLISLTPRSTAQATQTEAQTLESQLKGWEFEVPSYKYDGMFHPLEELLKKLPEPAAKGGKEKDGAKTNSATKTGKKPAMSPVPPQ